MENTKKINEVNFEEALKNLGKALENLGVNSLDDIKNFKSAKELKDNSTGIGCAICQGGIF